MYFQITILQPVRLFVKPCWLFFKFKWQVLKDFTSQPFYLWIENWFTNCFLIDAKQLKLL